jgi:hypothetical protein
MTPENLACKLTSTIYFAFERRDFSQNRAAYLIEDITMF